MVGLNDYARKRAKQLAESGYLAMAMDMYGNGATADNPDLAGKLAMPFYTNPALAKLHFDAAMAKIRTYAVADTTQIAAIGYCFGEVWYLTLHGLENHWPVLLVFMEALQECQLIRTC